MTYYSINRKRVVCIARFLAKLGKEEKLVAALCSLVRNTRMEEGCIRYELNVCHENPRIITVIEKFSDIEAFDEHCEKEEFKKFIQLILPNVVESSDIDVYREIVV